jgi:tetratricopeptide (TPR) repeat protein
MNMFKTSDLTFLNKSATYYLITAILFFILVDFNNAQKRFLVLTGTFHMFKPSDILAEIVYYDMATQIDPNEKDLEKLAHDYWLLGQYSDSIATIRKMININPQKYEYYEDIAYIYRMMGKEDTAKQWIQKGREKADLKNRQ